MKNFETLSHDDLATINGAGLISDTLGAVANIMPGVLSAVTNEIGAVAKSVEGTLASVPIAGPLLAGVVSTLL